MLPGFTKEEHFRGAFQAADRLWSDTVLHHMLKVKVPTKLVTPTVQNQLLAPKAMPHFYQVPFGKQTVCY